MSLSRLVQERKSRIKFMEGLVNDHCKDWFAKKQFLAIYMFNVGVRKRVAEEYYQILLDMGLMEEKKDGNAVMLKLSKDSA